MNLMTVSVFMPMTYDDSELAGNVNMILWTKKESENEGSDSGLKILI